MRCLVIGAGIAGTAAVRTLLEEKPKTQVTLVSINVPVNQKLLPQNLRLIQARVIYVWPDKPEAVLEDGERLGFDAMVLATGSRPQALNVDGALLPDVYTLKTDQTEFKIARPGLRQAVVVNSSLSGPSVAWDLCRQGIRDVTLVTEKEYLLHDLLDPCSAGYLLKVMAEAGIKVICGYKLTGIAGEQKLEHVVLDDGKELAAELLVAGKRGLPNTSLLKRAGGQVGSGIKVDAQFRTSKPQIYAAGACIENWDPAKKVITDESNQLQAWQQGKQAARCALGISARENYPTAIPIYLRQHVMNIAGCGLAVMGEINPETETLTSFKSGFYSRLYFRGQQLIGATLLGDIHAAGVYNNVIRTGRETLTKTKGESGTGVLSEHVHSNAARGISASTVYRKCCCRQV